MSAPTAPCGRFAPSTTGPAHPGTLLAALLGWLDARSRAGRILLRLEDLDPERCRPEWSDALQRDLTWLGLDWDAVVLQSDLHGRHEAALDQLEAQGRLYPCRCTRSALRSHAQRAPDGSSRYPGTCRERALPSGGWRASAEPLRARLPDGRIEIRDESGADLSQDPADRMGDPLVRRRDGALAYQLAGVVDDADAGVTRVVRGRDLAASTATQVALQRLLGLARPAYRHHLLLLAERGDKLAKLHGAIGGDALRVRHDAPSLVGVLACAGGPPPRPAPVPPVVLLRAFAGARVATRDRVLRVDDGHLVLGPWRQGTDL
jgi:glutamyl/glutaminyl-tRNA synthetase